MCIIVVESKLYCMFVFSLMSIVAKICCSLTKVVVAWGSTPCRKKLTRSCGTVEVEPELAMCCRQGGLNLKDHAQKSQARFYKLCDTVITGRIYDGEDVRTMLTSFLLYSYANCCQNLFFSHKGGCGLVGLNAS